MAGRGAGVTTAALLPTPGDPFIARYWVRNYERVWKGEVDELAVLINGTDPWEAAGIFASAGANVVATLPYRIGHGSALQWLVNATSADTVVLLEDDAYVREPGAIAAHLMLAAAGEVCGAPRHGMHPILEQAARDKWGDIEGPDGSHGAGLWPCFLFARREFLMDTDLNFNSRFWGPGTTIPGIDYPINGQALDTDTFTAIAFQLRAKHPITLVGQWKELDQKVLPEKGAPWFHAGGLSNFDEMPRENIGGTNEGRDWAHRCWWWHRTWVTNPPLGDPRSQVILRKLRVGNLWDDYKAWDAIIPPWINWADS